MPECSRRLAPCDTSSGYCVCVASVLHVVLLWVSTMSSESLLSSLELPGCTLQKQEVPQEVPSCQFIASLEDQGRSVAMTGGEMCERGKAYIILLTRFEVWRRAWHACRVAIIRSGQVWFCTKHSPIRRYRQAVSGGCARIIRVAACRLRYHLSTVINRTVVMGPPPQNHTNFTCEVLRRRRRLHRLEISWPRASAPACSLCVPWIDQYSCCFVSLTRKPTLARLGSGSDTNLISSRPAEERGFQVHARDRGFEQADGSLAISPGFARLNLTPASSSLPKRKRISALWKAQFTMSSWAKTRKSSLIYLVSISPLSCLWRVLLVPGYSQNCYSNTIYRSYPR